MDTRRAFFDLSPGLLREVLHLPEGTQIIGSEWNFKTETLRLYVCSMDFLELKMGELVPRCLPSFTLINEPSSQARIRFDGWNLETNAAGGGYGVPLNLTGLLADESKVE